MAAARLVTTALLLLVFAISGGSGKCMVSLFTDVSGYDLDITVNGPIPGSPLDCAVACRDDSECVAFGISPANQCWLKYAWRTPTPLGDRFMFYTGGEDCTALFTDQNGIALG